MAKKKLKNLANCDPDEFLVQTNRIRKSVMRWLTVTDLKNIRNRKPALSDDMTDEEKESAIEKQAMDNLSAMLDSMLEKHPHETAELLGLVSFIEPKDLKKYKMPQLLASATEMLEDEDVRDFFSSLLKLMNELGLQDRIQLD